VIRHIEVCRQRTFGWSIPLGANP